MMAQGPYFMTSATRSPPMRGPELVDGVDHLSTPVKGGVHFEEPVGKGRSDNQHGAIRSNAAKKEGTDGRGDVLREKPRNTLGRSSLSRPSVETRLCQHVENFVNVMGGPMAEGRHLLQLLRVR